MLEPRVTVCVTVMTEAEGAGVVTVTIELEGKVDVELVVEVEVLVLVLVDDGLRAELAVVVVLAGSVTPLPIAFATKLSNVFPEVGGFTANTIPWAQCPVWRQ